jgi:hypothetical protein
MVAWESSLSRVIDSVVGNTPGAGNAAGGVSLGPEPWGSGGPNCAYTWIDDAQTDRIIAKSDLFSFNVFVSLRAVGA